MFLKNFLRFPKRVFRKGRLQFWQSRQNCLAKSPNFFAGSPETMRKRFWLNWNYSSKLSLLRRNQSWQPCWYFSTTTPNLFAESPKLTKKPLVPLTVRNFLLENRKRYKNGFVWLKMFLQNVRLLRRGQFRQPWRKFSNKSPIFFADGPKLKINLVSSKKTLLLSSISFGHVKCHFCSFSKKFQPEVK